MAAKGNSVIKPALDLFKNTFLRKINGKKGVKRIQFSPNEIKYLLLESYIETAFELLEGGTHA